MSDWAKKFLQGKSWLLQLSLGVLVATIPCRFFDSLLVCGNSLKRPQTLSVPSPLLAGNPREGQPEYGKFLEATKILVTNELSILKGVEYIWDAFAKIYAATFSKDLKMAETSLNSWIQEEMTIRTSEEFERKPMMKNLQDEDFSEVCQILLENPTLKMQYDVGKKGSKSNERMVFPSSKDARFLLQKIPQYLRTPRLAIAYGNQENRSAKFSLVYWKKALEEVQISDDEKQRLYQFYLLVIYREACKKLVFQQIEKIIEGRVHELKSGTKTKFDVLAKMGVSREGYFTRKVYDVLDNLGAYVALHGIVEKFAREELQWDTGFQEMVENIIFLRGSAVKSIERDTLIIPMRAEFLNKLIHSGLSSAEAKMKDVLVHYPGILTPLIYRQYGVSSKEIQEERTRIEREKKWEEIEQHLTITPNYEALKLASEQISFSELKYFLPIILHRKDPFPIKLTLLAGRFFHGNILDHPSGRYLSYKTPALHLITWVTRSLNTGVGGQKGIFKDVNRIEVSRFLEDFRRVVNQIKDQLLFKVLQTQRDEMLKKYPAERGKIDTVFRKRSAELSSQSLQETPQFSAELLGSAI